MHTAANHRHGIRITNPKRKEGPVIQPISIIPTQLLPTPLPLPAVVYDSAMPNLIGDKEDNESIANVFCFGMFADKHCGVVYNDCTGSFLFMLLDGCVCFFVIYHYESNTILASPISGLDNISIIESYKKHFDEFTAKGF
jgi:hypothetical protein